MIMILVEYEKVQQTRMEKAIMRNLFEDISALPDNYFLFLFCHLMVDSIVSQGKIIVKFKPQI